MELNTRSFSLKSLVAGITAVGVFAISLVTYSQWLNSQDFDQNTQMLRLVQSVQQEIATAHLWFEEALGGDRYIDLNDDVRSRIRSAQALVSAAINGGQTPLGKIDALQEAKDDLVQLRAKIDEFDALLTARWEFRETTGVIGPFAVCLRRDQCRHRRRPAARAVAEHRDHRHPARVLLSDRRAGRQ
jgi:hypothetical protein